MLAARVAVAFPTKVVVRASAPAPTAIKGAAMYHDATVTISRRPEGANNFVDITVLFARRGGRWFVKQALEEDGHEVILTKTEVHLAQCLVDAGVDETGR